MRAVPLRARALGGLIALALAGAGAAFLLLPPAAARPTSVGAVGAAQPVRASADEGALLYLQNCSSCHGATAGGTNVAPAIVDAGPALLDYVLRTGRMPLPDPDAPSERRRPMFTQDQIASIVAYVTSLGGTGPPIPEVNVNGADIALGRELYIMNCASCHGAAGAGGAVGGGFVAPGLHESDPLTVAEAVTVGPGPMPPFRWDQHELDAIAAYVQQLRTMPNPGGLAVAALGPVPEGFVAIFVGLVAMVALVRWIGRRTESVHEPPEA